MAVDPLNASSPDFDEAIAIAKKALLFIGKFKTPPTPAVYEVWYRFAAGADTAIGEQLSHAVHEAKSVTTQQLEDLHQQFCLAADPQLNSKIRDGLEHEMHGLQLAIERQVNAGEELGNSIDHTNRNLTSPNLTPQTVESCVAEMIVSNEKMRSQLESMKTQLQQSQAQISLLKQDLLDSQKATLIDPLTGVGNRRCFDKLMETAIRDRDSAAGTITALILVDLDEFKHINDSQGHAVGDSLLKFTAAKIQELPGNATVTRYGGDEFGAFLRVTQSGDALRFAEAICNTLATNRFTHKQSGQSLHRVTASIGVAILRPIDTPESWFHRADKMLYCAKQDGRNCARVERQLDCTIPE